MASRRAQLSEVCGASDDMAASVAGMFAIRRGRPKGGTANQHVSFYSIRSRPAGRIGRSIAVIHLRGPSFRPVGLICARDAIRVAIASGLASPQPAPFPRSTEGRHPARVPVILRDREGNSNSGRPALFPNQSLCSGNSHAAASFPRPWPGRPGGDRRTCSRGLRTPKTPTSRRRRRKSWSRSRFRSPSPCISS